MATVTVDQQKLVMNAFVAHFQNNLVSKDLVTWRKFDGEMNDRNSLNVSEQVPPRYNVTKTQNGVADLSAGVQDSVFGSEQYDLDQTFGSSMGWGDFVKIRDIGDARESEALKAAAMNLAEEIDSDIMTVISTAFNNGTGNIGDVVTDYGDIASGYTRLKEEGVDDSDLRAVLTYADKQALGDNVVELPGVDTMSAGTYTKGFSGAVAGIPTVFTQQIPTLQTGTRTDGAINGAAQEENYTAVAVSGAPGQYLTQEIDIDGLGANATIAKGETFTIAGVEAWDNRLGQSLAREQEFTIVEAVTADGTGAATVRIAPALIVQGTNDVNTAHATVDSSPADGAVVAFKGNPSTAYKQRFIIQKGSIIVNTKDLILPATGTAMRKSLSKVPASVRMWQDSAFATGDHSVRFDIALKANIRGGGRCRGVRINGDGS